MKLSKLERLNLINQFLILEKLYPEEASYYEKHRIALAEGYELHYSWILENVWDGLSEEECREVLDVLEMYRAITFSYQKLEDKTSVKSHWVEFRGFDGNNESPQLAYCKYFIIDLERYDELKGGKEYPDFNSHMPTLQKYSAMRAKWEEMRKSFELSATQLNEILGAS